jgi:hypothetical protein
LIEYICTPIAKGRRMAWQAEAPFAKVSSMPSMWCEASWLLIGATAVIVNQTA